MGRIESKGKLPGRLLGVAPALLLAGLVAQGGSGSVSQSEATREESAALLPTQNISEASFGCISCRQPFGESVTV